MSMSFDIPEPYYVKNLGTMYGLKWDDLTLEEVNFAVELKESGHKFVIPECLRRVIGWAKYWGKLNERNEIWKQNIKVDTLKHRGVLKIEGEINVDEFGRKNIKYRDEQGNDKTAHIQPWIIIYCGLPAVPDHSNKRTKEEVPF
jgi:hypothetical protein